MGSRPTGRWTLVAVCATTFMLFVDIRIVNVALPSVQRELHASVTGLQWVIDPRTNKVTVRTRLSYPTAVTFGAGALWVANRTNLLRLAPN